MATEEAGEARNERDSLIHGLMRAAPDPLILVNRQGLIRFANPQAEQVFGYLTGELPGKPFEILMAERFRADQARLREALFRTPPLRATGGGPELAALRKDGVEFPVELSLSLLTVGKSPYAMTVVRDVSERQNLRRLKDEFLTMMSHELRTPLNFIMGFASLLDDEIDGPLNQRQHDHLHKVLAGADRMLTLVTNLIEMSNMASGNFHLNRSPTPYAAVVSEAVSGLKALAVEKRIEIAVEEDVGGEVWIDGPRVVQMLMNLVDNAIKFSPEGGEVGVRAWLREGALVTEVSDTGIGIASEDIPKLFKRFEQLDMSYTRQFGGTGLGLAICKTIAEAHGGEIGISSAPGRGSTFWFSLPLAAAAPEADRA